MGDFPVLVDDSSATGNIAPLGASFMGRRPNASAYGRTRPGSFRKSAVGTSSTSFVQSRLLIPHRPG